jgi:PadR family transcriptional regulator, regulatory protein PadR
VDRSWTTQIRKGLTELTILAALRSGEAYGYELLQRLGKDPLLASTPATLYPILARLADERLIAVREAPSPSGPPRRYYRLTPAGQKQLTDMTEHWQQLSNAVAALIHNSSKGDGL